MAEARPAVWAGRLAAGLDPRAQRLNDSLPVDRRLWPEELALSRAYATTLHECAVLSGPDHDALQAFVDTTMDVVTGEVSVELHRGRATAVARTSPYTLYRPDLASFDMTGYDAAHAEGFIRLFGLPLAIAARRGQPAGASAEETLAHGG